MVDKTYELERNSLIATATKFADSLYGKRPSGTEREREAWCNRWNHAFHTKMDKLWEERKKAS